MYRDDETARGARAHALIDEIAQLERDKLAHAGVEQRLDSARRQLADLEVSLSPPPPPPVAPMPGLVVHVCVFGAAAAATFVGYSLLL